MRQCRSRGVRIRPLTAADRERVAEWQAASGEGIFRLLAYVGGDNLTVASWIGRAGGGAERDDGDATLYSIPLKRAGAGGRVA